MEHENQKQHKKGLGMPPIPENLKTINQKQLIIIPCGGKKKDSISKAVDLYTGPYFKACLSYALSYHPAEVLILSAKYGLVSMNQVIEPYDLLMGQPGCVTADMVRNQARHLNLLSAEVVVVAGERYRKLVKEVWPTAKTPMVGVGAIGKQMAWLKANRKTSLQD